jgi:1-acyl-sn-glycerol-3-phosphate acyltransferase
MRRHLEVPNTPAYEKAYKVISSMQTFMLGGLHHSGGENLQNIEGSAFVIPNHDGWYDPVNIGVGVYEATNGSHLHAMAKEELWRHERLGNVLDSWGAFAVSRDSLILSQKDKSSHLDHLVANNALIYLALQATRKNHKTKHVPYESLKLGAGLILAKYGIPAVPTGAVGFMFPWVHFAEKVSIGKHDFDIKNRREMIDVGRGVVEPFFRDELQPRMQAAVDEASLRRKNFIASIPKNLLRKVVAKQYPLT